MKKKVIFLIALIIILFGSVYIYNQEEQEFDSNDYAQDVLEDDAFDPQGDLHDMQIKDQLSEIESRLINYYEDNNTYDGFDSTNTWRGMADNIPDCSSSQSYMLRTSDDGYVIWAGLCTEELFYCIDNDQEGYFQTRDRDEEDYTCSNFFENRIDQ